MVPTRFNYLNIADHMEMRDRLFKDRYDKWTALFPLPPLRRSKDDLPPENTPEYNEDVSES